MMFVRSIVPSRVAGSSGAHLSLAVGVGQVFALALVLALGCRAHRGAPPPLPASGQASVVFDQSLDQIYSPFDTAFAGMSSVAAALRRAGASVSQSSVPLGGLVPSFSGRGRVLVLGPATYRRYSKTDRAAVDRFLRSGGGVLVLVEHDDLHENATFQNELTRPYGIVALTASARARGTTRRERIWPRCHARRWGLRDVELYLAAPLLVQPPARPLLEVQSPTEVANRIVAATARVGTGRLAVVGDAEILWNMSATSGSQRPANRSFLLRLFRWLAQGPLDRHNDRPPSWAEKGFKGTVLFDDTGASLAPDDSPSGLGRFARALQTLGYGIAVGSPKRIASLRPALVVVAAPLEPVPDAATLAQARRLLLAGDAGSDLVGDQPRLRSILEGVLGTPPTPTRPVLDPLGLPFGVRWRAVTVVGSQPPRLQPAAAWLDDGAPWHLHRSGALAPARGESFAAGTRILAKAGTRTWTAANLVGLTSDRGPRPLSRPKSARLEPPAVVAVASKRLFALADVDALTNQHFGMPSGQRLWKQIVKWLEPFIPDPLAARWRGKKVCKRLREDSRQRVLRCTFAPGEGHERHFHAPHTGSTLAGGRMRITDAKGTRTTSIRTGSTWTSKGIAWHEVLNVGDTTAVFRIVEAK